MWHKLKPLAPRRVHQLRIPFSITYFLSRALVPELTVSERRPATGEAKGEF